MKKQIAKIFSTLLLAGILQSSVAQDIYTINARVKKPIAPTMWGLFFEDINRSGDGGIYAELVKNRSFDFPDPFMGWTSRPDRRDIAGNDIFQVINQSAEFPNDPKYLQVRIENPDNYFLSNEGFGGVTVKKGERYQFTLLYRMTLPGLQVMLDVVNASGKSVGNVTIPVKVNSGWDTTSVFFIPSDTTVTGKLIIRFGGTGKIDIDRMSLFPEDTWKKRAGGLRIDLVEKLDAIHPGFMRFPGGCIVEGKTIENRYQWKNTIGPLEQRKLNSNKWQEGAAGKPLPDYFQSYGLGFFEYFQLCEDMQSEPLPILNAGMSCQFDAAEVVPTSDIDSYIQDALDLIEFANGDASTKWGAKRIELGHNTSFNLKMIGVGNENWGPQYVERLLLFTKAIKAKYPGIMIITSTGYSPHPQFHYMDSVLRKLNVDVIDEHYYQAPQWFFNNAGKYDHYDRKGPKIFLGEYACHSVSVGSADNKNTLYCALAEAAFMTGLERNSDIVTMAAYAPLFAHVNDWQWTPNLIWFDNDASYNTPSYYVQQLFANNKGTYSIAITLDNETIKGQDSVWASAAIDEVKKELIIKLVNASATAKPKTINLAEVKTQIKNAELIILQSADPAAVNSIAAQDRVAPRTSVIKPAGKKLNITLTPYSFSVVKIRI